MKKRNRNGQGHCPECGGAMADTLDPKRIICPECGTVVEIGKGRA